ncbi:hypothetical protein NG2371_02374 [Nocardia gamkensis]|uniref:Uncharacterized protein n=2 Tax=Nocardia gamkensis TaxID=352869 RepID=A0A7X6R2C8_9NOCA|nr:hypothetical protein [Nocardia gamkensis]NKY26259.1 hypothetical protein [Nocardia gamkensis]NQE67918.1 hypothetical protein [Nocardia gamkensis]
MCADHAPIPFNARQRRTHRPEPDQPTGPTFGDGKGRMWVGPTSEQTRRLVAESRIRQGLPPQIDNLAAIESLALFLRNALNTLPQDPDEDQANYRSRRTRTAEDHDGTDVDIDALAPLGAPTEPVISPTIPRPRKSTAMRANSTLAR